MKVFEIRIIKNRTEKECGFGWPSWWGEVYQKVDAVAYEDHPEALGQQTEGAVCVTDDETWETIKAKKDGAITELAEAQANEKGRAWRPQVTRITNEQVVLLITAKAALGMDLTDDERKALDPDDPTLGIGKSKLFDVATIATDRGDALNEASL